MLATLIGTTVALLVCCLAMLMNGPPAAFIYLPSFIPVVLITTAGLIAGHGLWAPWHLLRAALAGPSGPQEPLQAQISTVRRLAWSSAVFATMASGHGILQVYGDPAALGPALSVLLLPLMYTAMLDVLVLIPLQGRLAVAPT